MPNLTNPDKIAQANLLAAEADFSKYFGQAQNRGHLHTSFHHGYGCPDKRHEADCFSGVFLLITISKLAFHAILPPFQKILWPGGFLRLFPEISGKFWQMAA
ncbi:MAG: hypothetical protein M1608_08275 [Candidatus Omnitrophica bacterium]|nr:hypothetical protein [Candidatus Omnitrophota bacterium]